MVSSATIYGVTGALLLTLFSLGKADVYPGDAAFQNICQEIIDDVAENSIEFKELVTVCSGWWGCSSNLEIREILARATLCNRLTAQHNTKNAAYIGGASITSSECQSALLGPAIYGIPEWNNWSGRHCGTWRSTDSSGTVTQTFTDNALWNTAVPSDGIQYVRQSVTFLTRTGTCCDNGWNESGGTEIVVWGWDPKDSTNHYGYQGSHVGYPFTSNSGADCIVWLTGEEAFLECVKTVSSSKKRTSAGFWGFGQWVIQPISSTYCPLNAVSDKSKHLPPGILRG